MKLHIVGIAGSLRRGSYNRATLRAASELCPPDTEIEIVGLQDIPSYNEDREKNPPASAWDDKPAAILGASISPIGTARAQYHLRQILSYLNMYTINKPEVLITVAPDKCNSQGEFTDTPTLDSIQALTEALVSWTTRLKKAELITY